MFTPTKFNLQYFKSHLPNDKPESWDILKAAAETEDVIGAVLRSHLFCEQILTAWIDAVCDCPNVLAQTRLSFSQKLQMAKNMGLPADVCGIIRSINAIRNELAHTHSGGQVNADSFSKLINQFNEILRTEAWHGNPVLIFYPNGQTPTHLEWQDSTLPDHQRITLIAALLFHHVMKQARALAGEPLDS